MNFNKDVQFPLMQKFKDMPDEFRYTAHRFYYSILPFILEGCQAVRDMKGTDSLESFEDLVEDGGIVLDRPRGGGEYIIYLFNLITQQYEDVTNLKEELEEPDSEEDVY